MNLQPIPISQLDEVNSPDHLHLLGYTDKDGQTKTVRIPAESIASAQYPRPDILSTKTYRLSAREEMYTGNITENVTLTEETSGSSFYGTLYMYITGGNEDRTITFPIANYDFFNEGENIITIPARQSVEIAVKCYGNTRVVTLISAEGAKTEGRNLILNSKDLQAQISDLQAQINELKRI